MKNLTDKAKAAIEEAKGQVATEKQCRNCFHYSALEKDGRCEFLRNMPVPFWIEGLAHQAVTATDGADCNAFRRDS